MKIKKTIAISFLLLISNNLFAVGEKMVVCKPIVDLRLNYYDPDYMIENRDVLYPVFGNDIYDEFEHDNNPLQDTQLLLGDKLIFQEVCGDWLKVQVLEQLEFKENEWRPKVGYIKKDEASFIDRFNNSFIVVNRNRANVYSLDLEKVIYSVSIGTKFAGINIDAVKDYTLVMFSDESVGKIKNDDILLVDKKIDTFKFEQVQENLVKTSEMFLNSPYSWGGRSAYNECSKKQQTGVDCSALVNLIYRANGFEAPRDASDQLFFCNKISGNQMQKSDLIFFESNKRNGRMKHVMMYLGKGLIVESTGHETFKTRTIQAFEKLGKNIAEINSGEEINGEKIYFGSFLHNGSELDTEKIKSMRNLFCTNFDEFQES